MAQTGGIKSRGLVTRYGFAWVTGGFFLISLAGQWVFGWFAFVNDQIANSQPIEVSQYVVQMSRDTLDNWQSEFLQLIWQVVGLSFLLLVGSPQSKEGSQRVEAKLDELLRKVDPDQADEVITRLDREYSRTG